MSGTRAGAGANLLGVSQVQARLGLHASSVYASRVDIVSSLGVLLAGRGQSLRFSHSASRCRCLPGSYGVCVALQFNTASAWAVPMSVALFF